MATNVILPALGMAQDSGKIVQWLKVEGDQVRQGEPIAEIETDKVTVELEAPATGTLARISAQAGDDVPVGQIIALILAADEAGAPQAASSPSSAPHQAFMNGASVLDARPRFIADGEGVGGEAILASPKARRLAAENGIDLAAIRGSGPKGAVLTADVLAAAPARPSAPQPASVDGGLSTVWGTMAERTTQSWTTVPHFFLMREVQASAFVAWHAQAQKHAAEKLTYTDLLVKIVATALRQHPRLNASWADGEVVTHADVHIGIAVAVPDGLIVPVIAHADDLSLSAIARKRKDLVERAQAGKLRIEDVQGGTFTISNLGMYGIDAFTAIVNAPQAAILAVGAVTERVVPVNGLPAIVPVMTLSLSCDHRVVDGARGAQFLATVADLIADPAGV
jgi:pyruvate dehydrogenase E2 component (dihydrolipoamide acetyltransferase)